jgi:hypothetical protein
MIAAIGADGDCLGFGLNLGLVVVVGILAAFLIPKL